MSTPNYPRTRRLLASAGVIAFTLAGCGIEDHYASERAQAESNRTVASAQLQSTLALSQTVGTLTTQNAALAQAVVDQANAQAAAWQLVVVILATGMVVSVALAVLIVARRRPAPQAPIYVLPASPTNGAPVLLDDPDRWAVSRADLRALRLAAQRREVEQRQLAAPEVRYRLTDGR